MSQLRNLLTKLLNVLAGVSFIAMVALTCWQVFTRYILGNPSSWSEELVSYLFAWMSLFGATLVVGERGHMNIPILVEKFNMGVRKALAIFAEIIALLFAIIILIYGGMEITTLAMGQMTSSLGVAVGVFYVVMPISGVLMVIYAILNIVDIINGNISLDAVGEAEQALDKVEKEGR
ncbi:MAG: TRAP transporter small permease [Lachnospiraceae bacterium]|nr:TRAP transporter small permease [Lachnospiraceae bacterium]